MTTIAYKNGILAADTQVSQYSRFSSKASKIGRIGGPRSGVAWAVCGDLHMINTTLEWIARGLKGNLQFAPAKEGSKLLLFVQDPSDEHCQRVRLLEFNTGTWDTSYIIPEIGFAAGSGDEFALGAMMYGASAIEAVGISSRIDNSTGGDIESLRLVDRGDELISLGCTSPSVASSISRIQREVEPSYKELWERIRDKSTVSGKESIKLEKGHPCSPFIDGGRRG